MKVGVKEEQVDFWPAFLNTINSKQLLKQLLKHLQQKENLQLDQLIQTFQQVRKEPLIPLSIFSQKLHPAEALCKYLRENEHLFYQEIAQALDRNRKSIWATYQRAKQRTRKPWLRPKEEIYFLPLSLFHNRSLSLLENVIQYLRKVHRLSNPQIAHLLHTSSNSVAVLAKRAREKEPPAKSHHHHKNKKAIKNE